MSHETTPMLHVGRSMLRTRPNARTVATGGAVVAMAAILGMASPIGLANSISKSEGGASFTSALAHPDAALVAPSHVVAWTAVTLAVCIFLSRQAQIAIARPALLTLPQPSARLRRINSRAFLRASRAGGLYGG